MANTQAIGVAFLDQNITGADFVYVDGELGYTAAARGSVTQLVNKAEPITLNKSAGTVTMNGALLAPTTSVNFVLNNSTISAGDAVIVSFVSGAANAGTYTLWVTALTAGAATLTLRNITAGNLSEAVVFNFVIVHAL
tara:strand:+ start:217 stop:630 length:414 start_codon:yes stop_codon:yes gene_type:complete